ncbi:unnamed protein product [Cuscuta epithymum]|uniref:Uncharacterized protein n=1 Tax=Cuscuta epithymum TaxID=186058 RepID=A0AAV0GCR6_9ASTE|nr:unnamed protein product [Cuscuta epithymum]
MLLKGRAGSVVVDLRLIKGTLTTFEKVLGSFLRSKVLGYLEVKCNTPKIPTQNIDIFAIKLLFIDKSFENYSGSLNREMSVTVTSGHLLTECTG